MKLAVWLMMFAVLSLMALLVFGVHALLKTIFGMTGFMSWWYTLVVFSVAGGLLAMSGKEGEGEG
ncbi:MAG: hypothetical protein V7744_08980 [Pseudomonadales bacterium]